MIETIAKIIETSAKYAWALLAVCLFVIFCPKDIATQIGIAEIRAQHLGYWWLLLVFSTSICIGLLTSKIWQWLSENKRKSEILIQKENAKFAIIERLYSLNESEQKWVAYCLLNNVRTLHATQINTTANSLLSKGLVHCGPGAITSLPFTFIDPVWEHLNMFKDNFLPEGAEENQALINNLDSFEQGLRKIY